MLLFLHIYTRQGEPAFQVCSPYYPLDANQAENTQLQRSDKTLTGLQVKSQLLHYTPFFNDGVMRFEGITSRIRMESGTSTRTLLVVQVKLTHIELRALSFGDKLLGNIVRSNFMQKKKCNKNVVVVVVVVHGICLSIRRHF